MLEALNTSGDVFYGNMSYAEYEDYYAMPPPMPPGAYQLQNLVRTLSTYYTPVLCGVGLVGNTLAVVLLMCGKVKQLSGCHYMLGSLMAEILYLLMLLHLWLVQFNHVFLYHIGGWCQFTVFLQSTSDFLSVWFIICLLLDVLLRSSFSQSLANRMCTSWRAKMVCVSLTITAVVVFLNISLTAGIIEIASQPVCMRLDTYSTVTHKLEIAGVFFNVLLPYTAIMVIAVVFILCRLPPCRPRESRHMNGNGIQQQTVANSNKRITVEPAPPTANFTHVFWVVVLTQLLFTLPLKGYTFYLAMRDIRHDQPQTQLMDFLWKEIFKHVYYTGLATRFLIFILPCGEIRREAMCLILRTVKCLPCLNICRSQTRTWSCCKRQYTSPNERVDTCIEV